MRFRPTPGAIVVAAMIPHIVAIIVVIMYRESIKASILPSLLALAMEAVAADIVKNMSGGMIILINLTKISPKALNQSLTGPLTSGSYRAYYPTNYYT